MKASFLLVPLAAFLNTSLVHAAGDAENGRLQYMSRCIACHSIDVSLAGPAHRGVFGAKAGSVAGFDYSPALRKSKVIWNERTLDQWLRNPEQFIPGQKMGYSVSDAKNREDLIAYLKTQTRR
ncbi:MAG: c-type cytochrome [Sulfuritalea sp.]|jgi:cytochrome c|nr:c-type cytochrome [Sulfuritalea sp.]